jgi:FKBP-type peptidyl-prolyl cis-trans isomerase 2
MTCTLLTKEKQMIEKGKKVKIHYKGTLTDGNVFDSSEGRDPLEFEMGAGNVIPGFEKGVADMKVGEKKTINIPCAEAYGEQRDEMKMEVERTQLPPEMEPQVGMGLQMQTPEGQAIPVQIVAVTDKTVTIDANHPLAGQDLTFELELIEIN